MAEGKKISFVVPVRNCGSTVTMLCESIKQLFADGQYEYELIFVNDSSTDETLEKIRQCRSANRSIKFIDLTRNFGQVAAIEAGLRHACGDAVIVMSADLQEPVALAEKMIRSWESGSKVVIACRQERTDGILDSIFSRVFYKLIKTSNPLMPEGGFDYCLFDSEVLEQLNNISYRNRFLQGDLLYLGYDTTFVFYSRKASSVPSAPLKNFGFKVKYFIDGILTTTSVPVRMISVAGITFTLFGIIYSIIILINWFLGNTPFEGWAPIMIAILIIGGLILFMLGVLGEYIWRIYDEMKQMPKYIIKDKELD